MDVIGEFGEPALGDWRLNERLGRIVRALAEDPSRPFPQAMPTPAEVEAIYRFLDNPKVSPEVLIGPHGQVTAQRANTTSSAVVVIHDSTEVYPAAADADGGFVKLSNGYGYLAHVSLVASADGFVPLGVARISVPGPLPAEAASQSWRERWESEDKLSRRWSRHALEIDEQLEVPAIHVMDREADSYEILHDLHHNGSLFVIRLSYNRRVGGGTFVSDLVEGVEHVATREVQLGVRKQRRGKGKTRRPSAEKRHPTRDARLASLRLHAIENAPIQRPKDLPTSLASELALNIVHVIEPNPPEGEKPVEWRLVTNLPVDTPEQVERIVDIYRRRWLIEEFFKCLKTGCGLNHRRPRSLRTAGNGFAILCMFAWQLLMLRQIERTAPTAAASEILPRDAIKALRSMLSKADKLPPNPRAHHILRAFARLGGHLKSNGPPGWSVLARGYFTFLQKLGDIPGMAWIAARNQGDW